MFQSMTQCGHRSQANAIQPMWMHIQMERPNYVFHCPVRSNTVPVIYGLDYHRGRNNIPTKTKMKSNKHRELAKLFSKAIQQSNYSEYVGWILLGARFRDCSIDHIAGQRVSLLFQNNQHFRPDWTLFSTYLSNLILLFKYRECT